MAAPATPYIGAQISLVSKSEIRYEGTLHFVDAEQSTLALKNVKSFGTEGRKQDGPQIPPSSEVYDVVSFRGSDIKDLTVLQSPVGGSTPNQAPAAEAPTAQPPYTTPYSPMSGMYAPTGGYMSGYPPAMYGAPQYGGAMYSGQYPMQTYPMPTGQAPPESSAPAAPAPPTAVELSEQAKPPPKADGQAQAGTGPSSQTTAGAGRGRGASSKPQQPTLPGSKPAWQGRGASVGAPTGRPAPGKGAWGKPVSAPNQAAGSAAAKAPPPVSKQDSEKPRSTPKAPVDSISQKQPSKPADASQPKPRPASFAAAVGGAKSTAPAQQAQPPRRGLPPAGKVNGGAPQQAAPVPVPNEEFDFESLLARFNKEELKRQEKVVVQTYNKDDFFDTMSSDALDKSKRNAHFVEQRKIDLETFGTTGDPSRFARPGGDRGRGRGTGSGGRSTGGRKPDGGQGGRGGGRGNKKTGGRG